MEHIAKILLLKEDISEQTEEKHTFARTLEFGKIFQVRLSHTGE